MSAMPSATEHSALRAGSYILVSASDAQDNPSDLLQSQLHVGRRKPRCFLLLPLLALLDAVVTVTLGIVVFQQELSTGDGLALQLKARHDHNGSLASTPAHAASLERRKIVLIVTTVSLARVSAYAIIGCSKRMRQQGVFLAALSVLATLFYVSIANMLFQARSKHTWHHHDHAGTRDRRWTDAFRHVQPTMPIFIGVELAFTLVEWIVYIAVVGVKIPPGANPVKAKRWASSLKKNPSFQHGARTRSLYASDPESQDQTDDSQDENGPDSEEPISSREHLSPPLSSQATMRDSSPARNSIQGYGSMLDGPRTPTSNRKSHPQHGSYATRSLKSSGQMLHIVSQGSMQHARSPSSAERGMLSHSSSNDLSTSSGEIDTSDEDAEASDPDDIMDITPNRRVARREARMRLAHAALPERRVSGGTLTAFNLFTNTMTYPAVSHSPTASSTASDARPQYPHPGVPASTSSAAFSSRSGLVSSTSSDSVFQPSSGMNTPSSSRSSLKHKKLRLPKWLKPKGKTVNQS